MRSKAVLAALALVQGVAGAGTAVAEDVKIGALMAMTGDLQAYGEAIVGGVHLAADQANAAGGVLGGQVSVIVGDTQTAAQPSIDAAQKLVSVEGVAGLIGALSSGNTIPVAQSVVSEAKVPMISPASTSPTITGLDDGDFLFRTVPSDAFQGVALAQVVEEGGYENVAVFYVNNDYGEGLAASFKEAFEQGGNTVTGMAAYEPQKASYRGELQQLGGDDAEALVLIAYPESGVVILRQALEEGYFDKFVFTDGMKAGEIIEQIGADYLNGSIGTVPQATEDTPSYVRFLEAYKEKFGDVPDKPFVDTAYDGTMLLMLAIEKAGTTDGTAVRDALREVASPPGTQILPGEWAKAKEALAAGEDIDYGGATGSLDFDEHGDVSGTFAEWAIEDGEIVTKRIFEPRTM